MHRLGKIVAIAFAVVVPAALAASGSSTVPGTWRKLPAAPFSVPQGAVSVWTGRQLIVFGRRPVTNPSADVAESYDPTRHTWRRLSPPSGPQFSPGYKAVWTGKEMLVFGAFHSMAFNAGTGKWRVLRDTVPGGITVWTGREAIGWGGGCCGDAQSNGAAYNPATNAFRKLPRSPLAPSPAPLGAWTGHELILFVSGFDPEGKPWPARFARAAAYDPAKNTWRRIASLRDAGLRFPSSAVWDGRELLVAGAGASARLAFAYTPSTNQWRRLASLPTARIGVTAVWAGMRLLLWGGQNLSSSASLGNGVAYDRRANRWTALPAAPLRTRAVPTVAWTGHALIVWGGEIGTPPGTHVAPKFPRDGASFTPATP